MGLATIRGFLSAVDQHNLDARLGRDMGNACPHHAGTKHADFLDRLIRDILWTNCAFFQRLFVEEQGPDHSGGRFGGQHLGEEPCLDLEGGVKGHHGSFVDRAKQRFGCRINTLGFGVDHYARADKHLQTHWGVRRTTGEFVALGIPRFHQIGIFGIVDPVFGGRDHLVRWKHLINQTSGFHLGGGEHFAFHQQGSRCHQAEFAWHTGRTTGTGEKADEDFGQAELGLWIVSRDDVVAGEWQLETNASGRAGQNGDDGFTAFLGFAIHASEFEFAQACMHLHDAIENALGRVVAFAHARKHVEVHAAGKVLLAGGDDDAFDAVIGKGRVNMCVQFHHAGEGHDVHGFVGAIPGDRGNTVIAFCVVKFSHFSVPFRIGWRPRIRSGACLSCCAQTRSMMVAAPMPEPMQSVARPVSRSEASISSSSVERMTAPVAPSG